MPAAAADPVITVALIGNPNVGKSTLFSALCGVRQRVGNYPGVTVEKKLGRLEHAGRSFEVIDLPGTYSLAPRSPDEMVAVDVLLGRRGDTGRPRAVILIVDASNLERNLYLVSQVRELELPAVLALNMVDVARQRGLTIDVARLQQRLGMKVVPLEAHRGQGLETLKQALEAILNEKVTAPVEVFPPAFAAEAARLQELWNRISGQPAAAAGGSFREPQPTRTEGSVPKYLAERLLLDTGGYLEDSLSTAEAEALRPELMHARQRLAEAGCAVPAVEAVARYGWVSRVLEGVVTRPAVRPVTASDRLDRVLTHRLWGSLVFLALMGVVFQSVFSGAVPAMEAIDAGVGWVADLLRATLPEGALSSLIIDGVWAGFGGVVVFLPQIFLLFFFIGLLEDCGYMARAAYLMDRLMLRVGLSGKSFIPLLSSFACAIPGIMATRTIENRRDRLTTMLIAPLMSCSARLPVYTLLILAFIPSQRYWGGWLRLQGLVMMGLYLLGMGTAVAVALVLKRTLLRGATPPFVMELPSYKLPSVRTVGYRMLDRGWSFVRRAGTLIVAVSVLVWGGLYFPHNVAVVEEPFRQRRTMLEAELSRLPPAQRAESAAAADLARLQGEIAGAYQRQSWLGRAGRWIEPVVKPLGWDWRIGCAVIASFPAREVVVSTLGVIYNLGGELDAGSAADQSRLRNALRQARHDDTGELVYSVPVALSILVFFSLCAQCASTLMVMRQETGSWRWPLLTFVYMTTLAYLAAWITYQVGSRL